VADPDVGRWQQLDRLCIEALELAPGERGIFLQRASGGDEALRSAVEALLECDEAAGAFLDRPAVEELAEALAGDVASLVGQDIGGYRIEALLGAGGMGEVYRARDLKLDRDVALKVLERTVVDDAADLKRFEEEARAASALNHPNIVTIYGVGESGDIAYIAMELVHGRTLRDILRSEPIGAERVIEMAVQLADALSAAHARGIVHRDLKPDNVMVTSEGLVKVLDFGIARRLQPVGIGGSAGGAEDRDAPTEDGMLLGTAGYMSPEQASGGAADHRSDQFSFGAILYELLTGHRAFERPTKAETLAAIVSAEPPPIRDDGSVTLRLQPRSRATLTLSHVAMRCLTKDPAGRYESTSDLLGDLRAIREEWRRRAAGVLPRRQAIWLMGGAAVAVAVGGAATWRAWAGDRVRSLAVLPFTNTEGDDDAEYLCDGLAGSLIRRLQLSGVEVKALSAVLNFKRSPLSAREFGRLLEADIILTGSLTRRASRLIVTAELVDVEEATHLWGGEFSRTQGDVLAVHDEIAAAIIREGLGVSPDGEDQRRFTRALTGNPRAYDLYLQAVHHLRLQNEKGYLDARDLLEQAIDQDRRFALACVTLASTHSVMAIDGYEQPATAWPRSTEYVTRALELDPELPDAHAEASAAKFYFDWNWEAADRDWETALGSRRWDVQPELLFLRALQMWALGRKDDALRFAGDARRADPLSAALAVREADLLARYGQHTDALAVYERVIQDQPDDPRAYYGRAEALRLNRQFDDAIAARRKATMIDGGEWPYGAELSGETGYMRIERDEARRQLDQLQNRESTGGYVSPLDVASAYARSGENERALEFLEKAFDEKSAGLVFLRVDPSWESVRSDLRFREFVGRMGFPGN
jgi:TolB-like protein/tetratricopeptide (TPR) repeat protein/predicted Ser/Thr protein kinase